jgi:hypothetical protein
LYCEVKVHLTTSSHPNFCAIVILVHSGELSGKMILPKSIFTLLLFCIVVQTGVAQFACNDETVMNVKGSWKKREDANMRPDKNQAQINSRIDNISQFFKSTYPNPKGIEASWYRTMTSPMLKNGPSAYAFNSLYMPWFCSTNMNKLVLGHETGTWAWVFINYFSWFMSNQYDKLSFTVNGLTVYRLPVKKGSWKGYPLYDVSSHDIKTCIILTRPGQLPWKPITEEQYLKGLRAEWDVKRKGVQRSFFQRDSTSRKSILSIEKSTFMQPADKQKVIAGLQKSYDDFQKRREADSTKQVDYWNEKINVIDDYLNKTNSQILQQPALMRLSGDFTGAFTPEEQGGIQLVTVNPSYFNKQLPSYVPQMIVLYWTWEKNAPSLDFKKQFEETFPIEKLQAMIDH